VRCAKWRPSVGHPISISSPPRLRPPPTHRHRCHGPAPATAFISPPISCDTVELVRVARPKLSEPCDERGGRREDLGSSASYCWV
jgi:hypothetical protein